MNKTILRHEFKYWLHPEQASRIRDYIDRIRLEEDRGGGPYSITSLYFDTPSLGDYYDKLAGLLHRKKLRARVYANGFKFDNMAAQHVWLEIKEKHNMTTRKRRLPISPQEWSDFSGDGTRFDASSLTRNLGEKVSEFSYLFLKQNYHPHVVTSYDRQAFIGSFKSDFRLTFDSNLRGARWRDFKNNEQDIIPVHPGLTIMEVKFSAAMPWWFKNMLEKFNLRRQAFSKYTESVDRLNIINKLPR